MDAIKTFEYYMAFLLILLVALFVYGLIGVAVRFLG